MNEIILELGKVEQSAQDIVKGLIEKESWRELASFIYYYTLNGSDYDFKTEICCLLSTNKDEHVRGMAILGFAHIELVHGKVDLDKVLPVIEKALTDDSEFVRYKANDAKNDLQQYIKKQSKKKRGRLSKNCNKCE